MNLDKSARSPDVIRTQHLMTIFTSDGCKREKCGAWAAAQLELETNPQEPGYRAKTVLIAAGCTACGDLNITQGDIGKTVASFADEMPIDRATALELVWMPSMHRLAQTVSSMLPPPPEQG